MQCDFCFVRGTLRISLTFRFLTFWQEFFFANYSRNKKLRAFFLNEFLFNCQTWLLFTYNWVFKLRYFARDRRNLRGLAYNYFAYKVNISHSEVGSCSLSCFIFMKLFFKKIFSSKILHDTIVDIEVIKTEFKIQNAMCVRLYAFLFYEVWFY